MKRSTIVAVSLSLLASTAMAQNLVVKDANAVNQTLQATLSGGLLYPGYITYGLFGGNPKAWALDTNGYGGVNVQNAVTIGSLPALGPVSNTGFNATSIISSPQVNPTVSTSVYVAGQVMGGILSLTVPNSGIVQNANISYASGTMTSQVDLVLFNANPTGGGTTDHAAAAIASADVGKIIGTLHVNDCTLVASTRSVCQSLASSIAYNLPSGTTIYAVPITRGTPTFGASTDVKVTLNVMQ